jgi:hypothetical protein
MKRPFPILAGVLIFVVQFALVGFSILRTAHNMTFLAALPVAAVVFLCSAFLLWKIPRYWRWVAALYFAIVILGSIRNYVDSSSHPAWKSLLIWGWILAMAWVAHALSLGSPVRAFVRQLSSAAPAGSRKRELIACSAAVCIAAGCVAAYVTYLQHLMKPIYGNWGIRLEPVPFVPTRVTATRKINLGYARLSIPASIKGDLVLLTPSGMVGVGPEPSWSLLFVPPHGEGDLAGVFRIASALSDRPVRNQFELKKLEMAQKPFSMWQIPIMGRRHASLSAMMLALKAAEYGNATYLRVFEDGRLGVILSDTNHSTAVFVEDLKSRIQQEIIVGPSVPNLDALVSAIVGDYELNLTAADPASVLRAIAAAGIKAPGSAGATITMPATLRH